MMNLDSLTATILGGLVSNPSIIAPNSQSGWDLVNTTPEALVNIARQLALEVINQNKES